MAGLTRRPSKWGESKVRQGLSAYWHVGLSRGGGAEGCPGFICFTPIWRKDWKYFRKNFSCIQVLFLLFRAQGNGLNIGWCLLWGIMGKPFHAGNRGSNPLGDANKKSKGYRLIACNPFYFPAPRSCFLTKKVPVQWFITSQKTFLGNYWKTGRMELISWKLRLKQNKGLMNKK